LKSKADKPKQKLLKEISDQSKKIVKPKRKPAAPKKGVDTFLTKNKKFGFTAAQPNHQWKSTRLRDKANNKSKQARWI
jgi:hypothetical protein